MDSSLVQEVQSYLNTIFLGRHSLFRDGCYASSFYYAPRMVPSSTELVMRGSASGKNAAHTLVVQTCER